jgi:hypothetical protein
MDRSRPRFRALSPRRFQRPTHIFIRADGGAEALLLGTSTARGITSEVPARNLRTRLIPDLMAYATSERFDFQVGNLVESNRQLARGEHREIDWSESAELASVSARIIAVTTDR